MAPDTAPSGDQDRIPTTAARIDPAWPITTEDDPQRVYCSNPVCGGVDVHPHYHRKPGNAATVHSDNCLSWHGPPNLCDCGVGGFASDGVEIRGLSLSATTSRHADSRSE